MKYTYDRVVLKQERFSVWRNIFFVYEAYRWPLHEDTE